MEITNYFDIKFIVNLSISITISLFIVFIFGKAIGDSLSEIVKYFIRHLGKTFLRKVFPTKFEVGFLLDRSTPQKFTYEVNHVINFGKLSQSFLPAVGIDLFVKPYSKLPLLYEGSKIRIQLTDTDELLGIYSAQQLPGKPLCFKLGEAIYENNLVNHLHVNLKPKQTFQNYNLPIDIFFQNELFRYTINLTVKAENK